MSLTFRDGGYDNATMTGSGSYLYTEESGSAGLSDSYGGHDSLVFTEQNGGIVLSFTRTFTLAEGPVTETITMTGVKN